MRSGIFTILLLISLGVTAQQVNTVEQSGVLYRKESSFGLSIHTRGFGLNYRNGKHLTGKRKRMLEIDLLSMKHPKEIKTLNQYYENTKGYVYGKRNNLAVLRGGIGLQNVIYQKEEIGNIEIRYSLYGGASFGLAKPIYLYVLEESNDPYNPNKVIEKYDPEKHQIDNIYGKAPLGYGLERTEIHPGIYGKAGLSFDWAEDDEKVRCLEVGIVSDYYLSPIQIMAFNKATPSFTTFYAILSFGRKSN